MSETLTLPEPARSLWLEKPDIIRNLPGEAGKPPGRAQLCGGTVLAARLKHRLSTDLPGRSSRGWLARDSLLPFEAYVAGLVRSKVRGCGRHAAARIAVLYGRAKTNRLLVVLGRSSGVRSRKRGVPVLTATYCVPSTA